jgi:hypothetical protein
MKRCYQAILRMYPAEYRAAFAPEMLSTFQQATEDRRHRGILIRFAFAASELAGLLRGLVSERITKWNEQDAYITERCASLPQSDLPAEVADVQHRLQQLIRSMEFAIAHHDFPKARQCSDEERITRAELRKLARKHNLLSSETL